MKEKSNNNEKIIKTVKRLLALANDNENDEEGQAAFLTAQKLMLKHKIKEHELNGYRLNQEPINEQSVTIYKKLFWWERTLAQIIGSNFRVKVFLKTDVLDGDKNSKSRIMFYGLESDLTLAREMYILAYEAVVSYANDYIDEHYRKSGKQRQRYYTESLKASYINGFLTGLDERFKEQMSVLRGEYEVLVLVPAEVEKAYKEMAEDFDVYINKRPSAEINSAYQEGKERGKRIDFTKKAVEYGM
ncbi:DUF2786 domain-containing protein [Listeria seeligeri]|uniref:DUF2786 domain-containing protein n=1 Tax=Listeria seeligeri TaxID=1640 RepID=UPI0016244284|nr:DUF2786 domain-containing protein [Listeria seeligeri]MBC1746890.1 DUF2786 domain-containing protein [Listeria seeligeri]MBC2233029.1 DUF2786 domain-containing protein [Listeria seeligeri]MBF2626141.1 DUF2786 domain-containing protein [Listeria seeligeri]MBF2673465.1 DUF2786 domain-containing protein [Listeria seeligeri]